MNDLTKKSCVPCEGGIDRIAYEKAGMIRKENTPEWTIVLHRLTREFKFDNFILALHFVNRVGTIAEDEGHHPDIEFGWGYVNIALTTHAIDGLSENDFIVAAKIDTILGK